MVYENIITGVEEEKLLPYEKCLEYGASSLDNAELLAAIIRTGTNGLSSIQLAEKLLENAGNLNGLYGMSVSELMQIKGIGKAKAVQICCILELSRRIAKQKARERLDFSNAETIAEYYMEDMRHLKREHLVLVMLDNRCRLIRDKVMSVGTSTGSMVSVREIFKEALDSRAASIVILHNHPSGNREMSNADYVATTAIIRSLEPLGIKVLDHIIVCDKNWKNNFSFAKEKYLGLKYNISAD